MPANPTEPSSGPNEPQTGENTPNIRTIKSAPGQLAEIQPHLIARPWFLAIPATCLFALLAAFAFRKRVEYLENNPAVARKLHVERITRKTMRSLNSSETQNDPNAFFAGVQLILRENIGITIDDQPKELLSKPWRTPVWVCLMNLKNLWKNCLNKMSSFDLPILQSKWIPSRFKEPE